MKPPQIKKLIKEVHIGEARQRAILKSMTILRNELLRVSKKLFDDEQELRKHVKVEPEFINNDTVC